MLIRGEAVLVLAIVAVAIIAIASVLSPRFARWRTLVAALGCAMAGLAPPLLFPSIRPENAEGVALWAWSAVGGPTIQASYRLDGLAATGLAIGVLYGAAALVATRVVSRSELLRPALLLNTFVFIALVVTDDLVADIVVLGALVAGTIFIALLVSPATSVARVTAYLATGLQAFIVCALLLTRFGGASFRFADIAATAVSPGVVAAASVGAALFAGLYPFVPWGYRSEESGERESLRGLLTMLAGVGATIVLLRIVGTTRIALSTLALPGSMPLWVTAVAALAVVVAFVGALRRRARWRRSLVISASALAIALLYPYLHWSHVVVVACIFTVAYAAAVSLSLPDQWPVTRYDVTLAAAWVGIACGTPTSVAAAIAVLLGGALAALAEAFWMPPHRAYIAMVTSTTTIIAGSLAVGLGAFDAPDHVTTALAVIAILAVVTLELVHVGRRLDVAAAPTDLEITSTLVALLSASLLAMVFAAPVLDALQSAFGRPFDHSLDTATYSVAALAVVAAFLAVVAGAVRPLVPDTSRVGLWLERAVAMADPVPLAVASFHTLERTSTTASMLFGLFERRAGVWLALVLIVGVLVWSAR